MFSLLSLSEITFVCLKTDPARNTNARSLAELGDARSASPPIRVVPVPSASLQKQRRVLGFPNTGGEHKKNRKTEKHAK